jgi:lysophospholipase L1-like esterase
MSVLSLSECPDVELVSAYALSSSSKRRLRAKLAAGLLGSLALFPLVLVQGMVTRRRMPSLPAAQPPHRGFVPGAGRCLRILAIGDSTVSGIGVMRGDETVSATTARALARMTGRPVAWHAVGLSGATAKIAVGQLIPRLVPEPADLLVVAFGVNDAMAYRSPAAFARDLTALVSAARSCVGAAAVVIAGVAPLKFFPGLPSPLRGILGWRCTALQTAAERLAGQLPRLVVERFSALFVPELFASDGFHPNARAHAMWGEEIAALALPLLRDRQPPCGHPAVERRPFDSTLEKSGAGHHAQSTRHRAAPPSAA